MIVIGERINGMYSDIKAAIMNKDPKAVHEWVKKQEEAGAEYLDVNVGPVKPEWGKAPDAMKWLVETTQETATRPVAIDSFKIDTVKAGLEVAKKGKVMINSTTGSEEKLRQYFPLAMEYDAALIVLMMDERGIPQDLNYRMEVAAMACAIAMEYDFPIQKLFLDPIVQPVKFAQQTVHYILDAIHEVQLICDPAPNTTVGLSNVSNGAKDEETRSLINRTFLAMAVQNGLTSAICDATDRDLIEAAITAELIYNKQIYSDDYVKAYLANKGAKVD